MDKNLPQHKSLPQECLLQNGTIVDTYNDIEYFADIRIKNGKIVKIAQKLSPNKNEVIYNCFGKHITSGFFDLHVHFREPGLEEAETVVSGSNAAMSGGFTGAAMMPNTSPSVDNVEIFLNLNSRGNDLLVDTYQIPSITKERKGQELAEIEELVKAGALGLSDDGSGIQSSALMKKALECSAHLNIPLMVHSEDDSLKNGCINEGEISRELNVSGISSLTEDIMIGRDILIAEYTNSRVHFQHVSTKGAVDLIRNAKNRNVKVTCEVTPHHFSLDDSMLREKDTNFKMNPPLRTLKDVKAIKEGLKDNTIDAIATDHAPHTTASKQKGIDKAPFGVTGIETAFAVSYEHLVKTKVLALSQMLKKLNCTPREILGLDSDLLKEGKVANLVVLDLNNSYTISKDDFYSKSTNSAFLGQAFNTRPIAVINKNRIFVHKRATQLL